MGKGAVPDAFINRDGKFVRRGLADWYSHPVITAANYDLVFWIQLFNQVVFADKTAAVKVGALAKDL